VHCPEVLNVILRPVLIWGSFALALCISTSHPFERCPDTTLTYSSQLDSGPSSSNQRCLSDATLRRTCITRYFLCAHSSFGPAGLGPSPGAKPSLTPQLQFSLQKCRPSNCHLSNRLDKLEYCTLLESVFQDATQHSSEATPPLKLVGWHVSPCVGVSSIH
jgi:hypothetical protein